MAGAGSTGADDAPRLQPAPAATTSKAMNSRARRMIYCTVLCGLVLGSDVAAHDPSSVPITWNREISRVVYDRCATCHRPGGAAFALITYKDAQPHSDAIRAAVVARRMPPWGAVKGFGDFKNDFGLTQEQISLFADWVEGGAPKGNNPNALPQVPAFAASPEFHLPAGTVRVSGDKTLESEFVVGGLQPGHVPDGRSMQIVAALPNGEVKPLLWLYEYNEKYSHPFLFRTPVTLPAGTVIRGVRSDAQVLLIPAATSWISSLPFLRNLFRGAAK